MLVLNVGLSPTRLPSYLRHDHLQCLWCCHHDIVIVWVYLVTSSYLRSRNEDGGHAIRSVVAKNTMLQARFTALCVTDAELFAIKLSHCRDLDACQVSTAGILMDVDLFCSCDLDLDPMTFIYELDPYSLAGLWSRSRHLSLETYRHLVSVSAWEKLSTSRCCLSLSHLRLVPKTKPGPSHRYTADFYCYGH